MKLFLFFCLMCTVLGASAQDPNAYLSAFDSKVYSLKTKGIKDFSVDLESSKLLRQVNDQMVFGKVESLVFRTYWTSNPERLAVEVLGLPEGFVEVKEELKVAVLSMMDGLLPIPVMNRFTGFKISSTSTPRNYIAKDQSGMAAIPSYNIFFDDQDRLKTIEGNRPVGTFKITYDFEKKSFSDGKWVLQSQTTETSESGQSMTTKKKFDYGDASGIKVLSELEVSIEQRWNNPKLKPLVDKEVIKFKNYKIDAGEALKYFLGEATQK
jgi:hypothetical protein